MPRLRLKSAAQYLDVSIATLQRRIRAGVIRAEKDGGLVFVDEQELLWYRQRIQTRGRTRL